MIALTSNKKIANMQDFICPECKKGLKSASALLQHFAMHASTPFKGEKEEQQSMTRCKKLPDLFPINFKMKQETSDIESDSGIEDYVNPMKFCLVTMEDDNSVRISEKTKKYECELCMKKFGWPTDLKRHKLIHTGERPFQCENCNSSFTRNFLLKKHQRRYHHGSIPELSAV